TGTASPCTTPPRAPPSSPSEPLQDAPPPRAGGASRCPQACTPSPHRALACTLLTCTDDKGHEKITQVTERSRRRGDGARRPRRGGAPTTTPLPLERKGRAREARGRAQRPRIALRFGRARIGSTPLGTCWRSERRSAFRRLVTWAASSLVRCFFMRCM